MRNLHIAAIQTKPASPDLDATYDGFERQVRATCKTFPHVQMVIAPELLLTAPGPLLTDESPSADVQAQPVPGPLTLRLGTLAAELGCWLIPGSIYERGTDGRIYNTAIVLSPTGDLVVSYRKIFPWQPYESVSPGSDCVVFDVPDVGRVGLAICYDGSFPEIVRQLAWLGAEVVIQTTLTSTRDREMELICARANAWTNQVFIVNLNGADPVAVGQSVVVDPEGMVRQTAGQGEEVIVDVLDLNAVTRVRSFGSQGINRPWQQMADHGRSINLPMYADGVIQPPPWTT